MKYIWTIAIVLAILIAGAMIYAWSGIYNIAATEPHWAITSWFIETLLDRSIEVRSDDIQAPNPDEAKLKEAIFVHYHSMCRLCHGAPDFPPEEFAKGLYPSPPDMMSGHIQEELGMAEIYWIVKHGIKMTGMPAFGPTHNEEELWGLVTLAKRMPHMTEQYRHQIKESGSQEGEMGHDHGNREPAGEKEQGH